MTSSELTLPKNRGSAVTAVLMRIWGRTPGQLVDQELTNSSTKAEPQSRPKTEIFRLEPLEARVLLSADLAPEVAPEISDHSALTVLRLDAPALADLLNQAEESLSKLGANSAG